MGRSYEKKNGKKVLLPTEKQLTKEAELKAKLVQLASGNPFASEISPAGQRLILNEVSKMSPQQIEQIIKSGYATDEFLKIKAAEALNGTIKDPNWKGKDEMMNAKSPHNIADSYDRIKNLAFEVAHAWDKFGRYMGLSTNGERSSVNIKAFTGTLKGGVTLHNHPSDGTRRLGQPPSIADFIADKAMGTRMSYVASKEGRYMVKAPERGWKSVSDKSLKTLDSKIRKASERAVDAAKKVYPKGDLSDRRFLDLKARLHHYEVSKVISSFCKANKMEYKFSPSKGYENLTDIKSVYKPLP